MSQPTFTITLTETQANRLLDYLSSRPYREVAPLIAEIMQAPQSPAEQKEG